MATRIVRRGLIAVVFLVALVALTVAAGNAWLRTSLPATDGSVTLAGIAGPVEIVRDENAVPHIFAQSPKDAYFALGYVHAQDRLWQMELTRRVGFGRLSEVLGEPALDTDKFIRTMGIDRLPEAILEHTPAQVRAALDAYAAGVNAWVAGRGGALPPEFEILGFAPEPWRAADSVVWGRLMTLRLGRNWKTERLRARIAGALAENGLAPERVFELWPDGDGDDPVTIAAGSPARRAFLKGVGDGIPRDSGSNGLIVDGRLTRTGKPILANDPHLAFEAPILWYLARLEAPGMTRVGATVPGVPFHVLGHNGAIAWGFTNAGGDVEDLFVETVDPADPDRYLTPEGSAPFATRIETIAVAGADPVELTVRETRHGPVVSDVSEDAAEAAGEGEVVALATPALSPGDRTIDALYAINAARGWDDLMAAAGKFHSPQQNIFFASTGGDIGFVSPGRIPLRKAGDGRMPVAGGDGAHDWTGFIPAPELPHVLNPPAGRIVNANNRIVGDDYPYLITKDWSPPFRAERIVGLLEGRSGLGLDDIAGIQRDVVSLAARTLVPLLLKAEPESERAARAMALLADWDFAMARDRPEPMIYLTWLRRLARALLEDELGADLAADYLDEKVEAGFIEAALSGDGDWCDDIATSEAEDCGSRVSQALERALDDLAAAHGEDMSAWRWGDAHRATFAHPVLTNVPVLADFADLAIASNGGENTINDGRSEGGAARYDHTHGPGYRAIYDLSDLANSRFVIATGESGNFLSPHYADLMERWRDVQYIRIAGTPEEVAARGIGRLTLVPGAE